MNQPTTVSQSSLHTISQSSSQPIKILTKLIRRNAISLFILISFYMLNDDSIFYINYCFYKLKIKFNLQKISPARVVFRFILVVSSLVNLKKYLKIF